MSSAESKQKSESEVIKAIRTTQKALEIAMESVIAYLSSTKEPTSEMAHQIIDDVLDDYECESPEGHIVAGGLKSAEPHEPGTGLLLPGEPIVIDIYPRHRTTGFYADMTRTVCLGKTSLELQKMYDTVLQAQNLALSLVKPGARGDDVREAVEQYFTKAGYDTRGKGKEFRYAEGFVHGIGHGVGQAIHDQPFLSQNSEDIIQAGDVITIEPGLYYRHVGGIRLEDMVLVTADGYKNLSNFPKQFKI